MSLEPTLSQKLTLDKSCTRKSNKEGLSWSNSSSSSSTAVVLSASAQPPTSSSTSFASSSSSTISAVSSSSTTTTRPPVLSRTPSFGFGGNTSSSSSSKGPSIQKQASLSRNNSSDRPASPQLDRARSARISRKFLQNWRSACGRTKDNLFRRWKTLPEDHPDFDKLVNKNQQQHQQHHHQPPQQQQHQSSGPCGSGSLASNIPSSTSTAIHGGGGDGGPPSSSNSGHHGHHGHFSKKNKNIAKKTSETELIALNRTGSVCQDDNNGPGSAGTTTASSTASGATTKPSAGWTVHVWATYVQRGDELDEGIDNEEEPPGRDFLSDFQKIKLTHFFSHVLDMNHDDVISAADFVALNQRIRHYIEWSSECIEFHILKEVHSGFLECFLNQPLDECSHMYYVRTDRETREHVNVEEWLDIWGSLLHTTRNLESLPLWLQYFPKILFQVINKSGSGTISKEELRAFYTSFLGIDFRVVNETLDSIHKAMTDENRNKLNYGTFKLCFANFLLARYPHGPGQFLFGICAPQSLSCAFPIDYSALNTPPDDLEPYKPGKTKDQSDRHSVIV